MSRNLIVLIFVLFSACSKNHEATSNAAASSGSAPTKEGDGVQNGGGTYQFYASENPLFLLEESLLSKNFFNFLYLLDMIQQDPYDQAQEDQWIKNFQKYQRIGFEKLAAVDSSHQWDVYANTRVPIIVTPNLYDMRTGAPLMASNFTKPAQIYLAPHIWIDKADANILPCEDTHDMQLCQEAQLATLAVHEKLGSLGFPEERSGNYKYSAIVYKQMLGYL